METSDIYKSIIERTMDQIGRSAESSNVRLDVVDAIRRKWISNLDLLMKTSLEPAPTSSNNALAANRAKYMTYPGSKQDLEEVSEQPAVEIAEVKSEDDDFEDEFGDAEIVHTTEAGRKMAESAIRSQNAGTFSAAPKSAPRKPSTLKKREIINPEDLDDESLDEPDYDRILEPHDCSIRVFGQTEVCETVVGPRRADSRWIVTILNGIVKTKDGKETLFRTAKQVMPHLHQHQ